MPEEAAWDDECSRSVAMDEEEPLTTVCVIDENHAVEGVCVCIETLSGQKWMRHGVIAHRQRGRQKNPWVFVHVR